MFIRTVLCALALSWLVLGCSSGNDSSTTPSDPYETYLANAPQRPADWEGEWPLSREDAQARALAGCGQDWAPGTIDAALREAYDPC